MLTRPNHPAYNSKPGEPYCFTTDHCVIPTLVTLELFIHAMNTAEQALARLPARKEHRQAPHRRELKPST